MKRSFTGGGGGSLELYLAEINRFPLLSVDEEQELARSFRDRGDTRAAHRLVTANLRFVVKVSYEYWDTSDFGRFPTYHAGLGGAF